MAEQSYPFENQSTSEIQYSALFRLLSDTGVAGASTSTDLRPYGDSSGMFVKVPAGVAVVRGFYYVNDSLLTLSVAAAGGTGRVDSVVLRLDLAGNGITAAVRQGAPGSTAGPALTQTDTGVWEVRLADVTVPANSTTVAAGQVTDRRGFTSLPWGEWTSDSRPAAPTRGKAGFNQTTGRPEFWTGNSWADFSTTTTDASALSSGTLPNGRLDYGVVAAVRGDRTMDAPMSGYGTGEVINGDWNIVRQPGVYRIQSGTTATNSPRDTFGSSVYMFGTLVLFGAGATTQSRTQVYYEHGGNGYVYTRTAWNGTDWNTWQRSADLGDLAGYYTKTQVDAALATRDSAITAANSNANGRTLNTAGAGKVAAGNALVTNLSSTGYGGTSAYSGYVDVTWPSMTIRSVVATAQSADTGGCSAQVTNMTSTGCRIVVVRRNNVDTGVNWVAVGT